MSFSMTPEQQQAFTDAAGVGWLSLNHLILALIAVFATIWLLLYFIGSYKSLRTHKIEVGDFLFGLAIALLVYIVMGAILAY